MFNSVLKKSKEGIHYLEKTTVLIPMYEIGMKVGWLVDPTAKKSDQVFIEGIVCGIHTMQNHEIETIEYEVYNEDTKETSLVTEEDIEYFYPEDDV